MDSGRFDDLARTMVSTSSRRVALPAVVGALVGLPGIAAAQDGGGGAGKLRRGDSSSFEVVEKPAKRLVQDDPDGDGGARASGKKKNKKKAKKQPIGIRQVWYWQEYCETDGTTGRWCRTTCPANMQAIGGGMWDMSVNGLSRLNAPGDTIREWDVSIETTDSSAANGIPYVVCLRK